jgi:hypothetical protein
MPREGPFFFFFFFFLETNNGARGWSQQLTQVHELVFLEALRGGG